MADPFDLQRFVDAHGSGVYDRAVQELRDGRKQTHWMWFVFPQLTGLGRSATARHFALSGLPEARAYLGHPVLGPRLTQCARLLTELSAHDPVAVFGAVDAQKLQSSMTLFNRAAADGTPFQTVLDRYFEGRSDEGTTARLPPGSGDGD